MHTKSTTVALIVMALSLFTFGEKTVAQIEGWCPNEENVAERWVAAGSEEAVVLTLPQDDDWRMIFPPGCIPDDLPPCCSPWPDSIRVEFGRLCVNPDDEGADPLMFGAIGVNITDPDGANLMVGGMLIGFTEPIELSITYNPDELLGGAGRRIAERNLTLKFWDEWFGEWVEPRDVEVDYDAHQIRFSSYTVYTQYALYGSEFLNRPPEWEDVPDRVSGREGEEIGFDLIGSDPDEDDELSLEMLSDNLPPEARFGDNGDGTGRFYWTPDDEAEGEYLARFILGDGEDEVEAEVPILVQPSLSVPGEGSGALPISSALLQNYPNPFNPSTTIRFSLSESDDILLEVFDLSGVRVAVIFEGQQSAGPHSLNWQALRSSRQPLPAAVYLLRMTTSSRQFTMPMQLLK